MPVTNYKLVCTYAFLECQIYQTSRVINTVNQTARGERAREKKIKLEPSNKRITSEWNYRRELGVGREGWLRAGKALPRLSCASSNHLRQVVSEFATPAPDKTD